MPFLVLAGDLDTVSSPAWADAFAEGLSAAQIVHFPGVGTQPTGGPPSTAQTCARQIRDQFLAEPERTRRRLVRRHVTRAAVHPAVATWRFEPPLGTPPATGCAVARPATVDKVWHRSRTDRGRVGPRADDHARRGGQP